MRLHGKLSMKISDYIASFLEKKGVDHVFEVIGGMITHLIDSIYKNGKISIISMHHEQAAAFAAEAMARMNGVPGVVLATSGPGATNLITGIGSCYFDSVPAIFITGQVNRDEQKGMRSVRQLGFQETDVASMVSSVTKGSWRVESPEEVPILLEKAFRISVSGRPGPVLLDIPMDVQRLEISIDTYEPTFSFDSDQMNQELIDKMFADLSLARRPLVLAGGGIRSARAVSLFRTFIEHVKIPVVNSLMAIDVLPYSHPLRVGFIGTYGNRWANLALGKADFIMVVGSRLDIRQTGSNVAAFKGNRPIYHIDCDPSEINNRVKGCVPILAQLDPFLKEGIEKCEEHRFGMRSDWVVEIEAGKKLYSDTKELATTLGINPNVLMHEISRASSPAVAFTVDVGQHQMWAAQSLELNANQRFLTSGGMGAMGFALPAAIGASLANVRSPTVVIAGDGGFQLNIQELETVAHNNLPIKMVIINNKCYGMVRQFQQSYFNELYPSTLWGYSAPDFELVAKAYGIEALTVREPEEIPRALEALWNSPEKPFLLQVMIDTFKNVYPKVMFGLPITEMETG